MFTCNSDGALVIAEMTHYSLRIINCHTLPGFQYERLQHGGYDVEEELNFCMNECPRDQSHFQTCILEELDLVDPRRYVHIRSKVKIEYETTTIPHGIYLLDGLSMRDEP